MNEEKIINGYYQSNIKTSRNEDGVYTMKYTSQQMLIDRLQEENVRVNEENKQLKDRMNKALLQLSDSQEYSDSDFESMRFQNDIIDILKDDMSDFFKVTGDYKYMWVDGKIYNELKNHVLNGGYVFIECPYQKPIKLKVVEE